MGNRIAGVFQKHEKKAGRPWEKIGIDATKTWKRKPFSWPVLKIKNDKNTSANTFFLAYSSKI